MKIAMAWHYENGDTGFWSTPLSFANGFKAFNHSIDYYGFIPANCDLSNLIDTADSYDLIFICLAGPSPSFDNELIRLKSKTNTPVFMEFGDDIPTSNFFMTRKMFVDHIATPDLRCCKKYLDEGLSAHWCPNFCDPSVFYKKDVDRQNICVTTCGHDRPLLKEFTDIFGDRFVSKRVLPQDNADFYNSGTFTYQYARWNEITRRIFEAGGCGNAIITNRLSEDSGIYELFPEDECVAYFSTPQEAYEKMARLYEDDEYRNKLSSNIYKTIIEKHLAKHRAKKILEAYDGKLHNPTNI